MQPTAESSPIFTPSEFRNFSAPTGDAPKADPVTDREAEHMVERPVDGYADVNGHPLIAEILDISSMYKHLGLGKEIETLDTYILDAIKSQDLQPTESSYRAIFQELEDKLGLDPNLNVDTRVQKVSVLAGALLRIKREEALKELINGPQ